MSLPFTTALTFFVSCEIVSASDAIFEDELKRIIFQTVDDDYGCVVETEDGSYDIEIHGELVYTMEPEIVQIVNMHMIDQGASILKIIHHAREDNKLSYRSEKFAQLIEETVESFAYNSENDNIDEQNYIFPVIIFDMITPLHLN